MRNIGRGVLVMMLLTSLAQGQTVAKYAGEFMSIGVGGRALGLGGAHVALANDATAGYWNPGALARINYPEAIVMHDERFGNLVNYDFVSVAIPYGTDVSLGLSVLRLGVDGIPDTRNAWIDSNGNGIFDNVDRLDYDKITYFNAADWAIYFTYAKQVSAHFMYGANVKLIRRDLAEASATGIGFDIGALYSPLPNLYLGVNAQDITTTLVAWSTGRNELITPTVKFGTTYFLDLFGGRFAPVFDVDLRFENRRFASIAHIGPISIDPHTGLEFDYKNTVALRVGYSDVKQITVGAGVHLRKIDIDYSFAKFGGDETLGNTHRISLRFVLHDEKFARSPVN
ncbi:MAG: PorV/PorQ family protein [Ignavibacteriales bacterium]|nr:PorV/PorQ family protein [Ignavibacteriales bacterium]